MKEGGGKMKNKILAGSLVAIASIAIYAATMPCLALWHQPKTLEFIA